MGKLSLGQSCWQHPVTKQAWKGLQFMSISQSKGCSLFQDYLGHCPTGHGNLEHRLGSCGSERAQLRYQKLTGLGSCLHLARVAGQSRNPGLIRGSATQGPGKGKK